MHSLHAEMNVLLQALKMYEKNPTFKSRQKLNNSTVYVVRIKRDKYMFGCSKPCQECEPVLLRFQVSRVYYTDVINGVEVLCEMRLA